jgi:hypothetical protein
MAYAVEVGSSGIIYIPSFIKTTSGIQNLIGRIHKPSNKNCGEQWILSSKQLKLNISNAQVSSRYSQTHHRVMITSALDIAKQRVTFHLLYPLHRRDRGQSVPTSRSGQNIR